MNLKKTLLLFGAVLASVSFAASAAQAQYLAIGVGIPVYRPIPYYGPYARPVSIPGIRAGGRRYAPRLRGLAAILLSAAGSGASDAILRLSGPRSTTASHVSLANTRYAADNNPSTTAGGTAVPAASNIDDAAMPLLAPPTVITPPLATPMPQSIPPLPEQTTGTAF